MSIISYSDFMQGLDEALKDLPDTTDITYEVWALGYTSDNKITDTEIFLEEFDDLDKAKAYVEGLTSKEILEFEDAAKLIDDRVAYFSVEIQTVVDDPDDDGTISLVCNLNRELWLADDPEEEEPQVVIALSKDDYSVLEDGTLKVSCECLKGFNKNDYVMFHFIGEESDYITYKIISKVAYDNGDYYHCEIVI